MCKEDVRIGRRKRAGSHGQTSLTTGVVAPILGINPNRSNIVVVLDSVDTTDANVTHVRSGQAANAPSIGCVSAYSPTLMASVDDLGGGVTGPVSLYTDGAGGRPVNWVEYVWDDSLENL